MTDEIKSLEPPVFRLKTALWPILLSMLALLLSMGATFWPQLRQVYWHFFGAKVTLAWDEPPEWEGNGSLRWKTLPVRGYNIWVVQVGPSNSFSNPRVIKVGKVTKAKVTGLKPGKIYAFAAQSVGVDGTLSDFSNYVLFRAPRNPKTPIKFWMTNDLSGNFMTNAEAK